MYLLHEVIEFVRRIERRLVGQDQRFDHVQRCLLVFPEVFRGDVLLVSLAARIGFENRHLAGILLFADGVHRQYARFGAQGDFAHFGRILHILVEILRINLYLRQPYDAVGRHRLFGAHPIRSVSLVCAMPMILMQIPLTTESTMTLLPRLLPVSELQSHTQE